MCELSEDIVGIVLQVVCSVWSEEESDLILTNQRMLLLKRPEEPAPKLTMADLLPMSRVPNMLAVGIGRILSNTRKESEALLAESRRLGVEGLSAREGSLSIPYAAISSISYRKGLMGRSIQIHYADATGRNRKMDLKTPISWEFLSSRWRVPPEAIEQVRASGDYARFSKEVTKDLSDQLGRMEEDYETEVEKTLLASLPTSLTMGPEGLTED